MMLDPVFDSGPENFEPGGSAVQPSLFAGLSELDLRTVMDAAGSRKLKRKETLFFQGEPTDGPYVVTSGTIRTQYTSPSGREITLAFWSEGNLVGTPLIMGEGRHMWSGVAATDCEVLCFRGRDLRRLAELIPRFAMSLIEALEFKCVRLSSLAQTLGTRAVEERLSLLLYNLAVLHGSNEPGGIALGPPFTHEVLANMVGCSRQWVTNILQQMKHDGIIRIERRRIVILQPNLLLSHFA